MESMHINRPAEGMEFSYPIIWSDSFSGLAEQIRVNLPDPGKICIVTDSMVAPLYLDAVTEALKPLAGSVISHIFPAGEENKNLDQIRLLYTELIRAHFERRDLLVALGGGVVGDMTGFTAATYLRGIPYIQVPTTLLAEVDSSVGGKTGVDLDQYKNMVGTFYQPGLVYMNMRTLETLPDRQFSAGMAEVIKSALIRDRAFFDWLEDNSSDVLARNPAALTHMIRCCCGIKAAVVAEDPKETGLRAILNYGHTIGHAIEKLSDFRMLHGDCVAVGMAAALSIDVKRGTISAEEAERIRTLLRTYGLPLTVSGLTPEGVLETARSDKKAERGQIRFVLLAAPGQAELTRSLTDQMLLEAVRTVIIP